LDTNTLPLVRYELQGPVGLPLENEESTRVFREVEAGTLETIGSPDSIDPVKLTAAQIVSEIKKEEKPADRTVWTYPIKWAGVDVQFFTALVIPTEDQSADKDGDGNPDSYFEEILPTVLETKDPESQSDISLVFKSVDIEVPANKSVTHSFNLYLGPKQSDLLETVSAEAVIDYSSFFLLPTGVIRAISKGLHGLLGFFHNWLHLPYWLAIILLTVMVRACLFPLSRKQVKNMQKLKDLQPRLQELEKKYADDKEKRDREKLQLMMKHGANPLSGCLPLMLQMPIFIGLWGALSSAIDLRLAKFLWINNLAAPDQLFPLGFTVPWFGWTWFNALPIIVIVLFQVQNSLFTPPPTNDEQAMQQKMMKWMMCLIGFMFYSMPAGLNIYFIASSFWGIAERKLLDKHKAKLAAAEGPTDGPDSGKTVIDVTATEKKEGFIAKLLAAADQAKHQTTGQATKAKPSGGKDGKGTKGSKSRKS